MPRKRSQKNARYTSTNPSRERELWNMVTGSDFRGVTQQLNKTKKLMGEVNGMAQSIQTMIPELSRTLRDLGTGAKNTRQVFSGFARSILADMDRIAARRAGTTMRGAMPPLVGPLLNAALRGRGGSAYSFPGIIPMANGGVFDRPTLGLIAERPGAKEAVVPLPDGRSIPVRQVGPNSGGDRRPVSIINVIDPRMIQSVVAQYLSENHEVVLNMINESSRNQGISNPGRY